MPRLSPAALLLLSLSACAGTTDISESLSSGLVPTPTDTDPTPDPTMGEGSTGGGSADETATLPTCTDGMQGEDETDVDCGGSCEPCDNGQGCAAAEDCSSGTCQGGVCVLPTCGNGTVDAGETCDDAGESATCNVDCTTPACGDGLHNGSAGEACDEGGNTAACNADCTVAACGDGVLNIAAAETCDEGGETATCNADCTAAACGDGVLNVTAGEACDGGGNTAVCDADCTAVACGDGSHNPAAGEACDAGGESAACDVDCTAVQCGDGNVNAAAGEQCEAPTEFCGPGCLFTGCQPDPVALAMAACLATYPTCTSVNGGIVGTGAGVDASSNCGTPAHPWRFYCTVTSGDTNYNCSACTVGEILGAHDPCNCDPGTSPVLGSFCM